MAPRATTRSQRSPASSTGTISSTPCSPVYPVRLIMQAIPSSSPSAKENAGASGSPRRSSARGPWTASNPYSSEISRTSEPGISRSLIHSKSPSWLAAFTISRKRNGLSRYTIRSSTIPPESLVRSVYCAWPSSSRSRSFESSDCRRPWARGPSTSSSPMCETSKTPQSVRTALCSGMTPSYCTGISQPANGTMRAPRATCRSKRGVRRSVCIRRVMLKEAAPVPPPIRRGRDGRTGSSRAPAQRVAREGNCEPTARDGVLNLPATNRAGTTELRGCRPVRRSLHGAQAAALPRAVAPARRPAQDVAGASGAGRTRSQSR